MRQEITLLTQQATNTLTALAGGSIEFCNDDYSVVYLARTLQTPAGTIATEGSASVITISGITGVTVSFTNSGTITKVRYKNSSGVVKLDELSAGPIVPDEVTPDTVVDNPTVVTGQTGTFGTIKIRYI